MKKFYGKCEQVLVTWMTSQMVNLANLIGLELVSFFDIFVFQGVNILKDENHGKCHVIFYPRVASGAFFWGFSCKKNQGASWGL